MMLMEAHQQLLKQRSTHRPEKLKVELSLPDLSLLQQLKSNQLLVINLLLPSQQHLNLSLNPQLLSQLLQ